MFEDEKYIELFKEEATEHLERLESLLIEIEKQPDEGKIKEAKRSAHTIKGSARLVGLTDIGNLAHKMEDLFKAIEEKKVKIDQSAIDALLNGVDTIKKAMEGSKETLDSAISTLVDLIEKGNAEKEEAKQSGGQKKKTKKKREKITEKSRDTGKKKKAESEKVVPFNKIYKQKPKEQEKKKEIFRVPSKKIENIINLAGELLVEKIRYQDYLGEFEKLPDEFAEALNEKFPDISREYIEYAKTVIKDKLTSYSSRFTEDSRKLSQRLFEIQEGALALKIIPFYTITDELRRYVREISKEYGKSVNLSVEGEDVELDRSVLDEIKPALMHIINNAISHGIEEEEVRKKKGKVTTGLILVRLYTSGSQIILEVMDDGRGLDVEKIKMKALEKGLIDDFAYDEMSDEESLNLIFVHGFSTADKVSQMSGRGVGMDVVRGAMNKVKGEVKVESQKDKFTKVVLSFPQTTSIIKGLWVKIGEEKFVIPIYFIDRVVRLKDYEIISERGERYLNFNDRLIPLVDSLKAFGWGAYESGSKFGVILRGEEQVFCIYVDEIEGEEEILVRSPGPMLENKKFLSGFVIGDDGLPYVILEVSHFKEEEKFKEITPESSEEIEFGKILEKRNIKIMVVDDSPTTLNFEKDILLEEGFEVITAINGEEAWKKLQEDKVDLLITDIDMPVMDGLELTGKVKSIKDSPPVIVVSSLGSERDIKEGLKAGANAYIVKKDFTPALLVKKVKSLLGMD